jgi:hypothetical protein
MYAPLALNSFASDGSTRLNLDVTFLTLSLGTHLPQFVHCTRLECPFPPFDLPLLLLFFVIGLDMHRIML